MNSEAKRNIFDATFSEPALARDWLRKEEDAAWAHLVDLKPQSETLKSSPNQNDCPLTLQHAIKPCNT